MTTKGAKLIAEWDRDKGQIDRIIIENRGSVEAVNITIDAEGCDLHNGESTYSIVAIQPGCNFKKTFSLKRWRSDYDPTFVLTIHYTDETGTYNRKYHMSL